MNVLSLFDGLSSGQIALNRAGVKYDNYYASEIDKYAIKVTQQNYPNTIQLGDVTQFETWDIDWSSIGLVTGGFPCQAWSLAGKQLGDKDERGQLFWVMLEVIKKVLKHNPEAKFLMENVKMKKEFEQYITFHTEQALGKANKHLINSALVSAQNRNRYYWTNIEGISQPEDKGITIADILEKDVDEKFFLSEKLLNGFREKQNRRVNMNSGFDSFNLRKESEKSSTLTARYFKTSMSDPYVCGRIVGRKIVDGKRADHLDVKAIQQFEPNNNSLVTNTLSTVQKDNVLIAEGLYRRFTPLECERLQTVPDNYTSCVSNSQRYKMLGNGWTVDVIAHIFKRLLK